MRASTNYDVADSPPPNLPTTQDGRFDKADRLFQSLPDAYRSCTRNPGDVKEAIPELYYLPELFVNATGVDLGCPQTTGKPIGNVQLPPWARGDPWEFVRRHREALESEHVSLRLHRWVDLVFGCRQRPPALNGGQRGAVESCNVFFHLTYPGAVDLPRLREQDPIVSLVALFWPCFGSRNTLGAVSPWCWFSTAVSTVEVDWGLILAPIKSAVFSCCSNVRPLLPGTNSQSIRLVPQLQQGGGVMA